MQNEVKDYSNICRAHFIWVWINQHGKSGAKLEKDQHLEKCWNLDWEQLHFVAECVGVGDSGGMHGHLLQFIDGFRHLENDFSVYIAAGFVTDWASAQYDQFGNGIGQFWKVSKLCEEQKCHNSGNSIMILFI